MANGLPPTPTEALPQVAPADMEPESNTQASAPTGIEAEPTMPFKRGVIHINGAHRDRWLAVLHHFAPEGTSQHAKMAVLLERLEAQLQAGEAKPDLPEPVEVNLPAKEQTINYQAQTLAWLTTEVEQLRRQVAQLQAERDTVAAVVQPAPALEAELAQLRAENGQLRQAQAKLEAFRKLLTNGNGQEAVSAPEPTTTKAPPALVTTPTRTPPITSDTKQTVTTLASSPVKPQRRVATGAQARATGIFEAVCEWNDTPGRTLADKWCVTSSFLETQFGIHRQAVKEWFEVHGSDVEAMHAAHGITQLRTQNRGKDITPLKAFIANQHLEA